MKFQVNQLRDMSKRNHDHRVDRLIKYIYHNMNGTFDYCIDKIETSQIIQISCVNNLKNYSEVMEMLKND